MSTNILGLDHVQIAIPPDSEERARSFYAGVLGLREVAKPEVLAARGGLWLACGAQQLHLGVEADFRAAKKAHPAFEVSDLAALRARLDAGGVATRPGEDLPGGVRRMFVDDPFGNRLEFLERT